MAYLDEKEDADHDLDEIVDYQQSVQVVRFSVFHVFRSPARHEVEVKAYDGQSGGRVGY